MTTINEDFINIEEHERQVNELAEQILNGNNSEKFLVIDMEAGTGKTRNTEKIIADNCTTNENKYIFVRPEVVDCEESTNNINSAAGREIATYYDSKKYNDFDEKQKFLAALPNYKVVCITHAKYRHLCKDELERNAFTECRKTLIIDEFINPIEKVCINDNIARSISNILYKFHLTMELATFDKLCTAITSTTTNKNGIRVLCNPSIIDCCKAICESLNATLEQKDFYRFNNLQIDKELLEKISLDKKINKTLFINYIDSLKHFANTPMYYESYNKKCITYNKDFNMFKLANNIILDASADLQPLYQSDNYTLAHFDKVCNHSNFTLCNIPINTSARAKMEVYTQYHKDVLDYLSNKTVDGVESDNTLIIGNKADKQIFEQLYNNYEAFTPANIAYFGDIIGKNDWRNLDNCAIIQTPRCDNSEYILMFLYLKAGALTVSEIENINTGLTFFGKGIQYRTPFNNADIEKIYCLCAANEMYQAIKRINRNMNSISHCYLFFNNSDVLELIEHQLRECNVELETEENIKFKYEITKKEIDLQERKRPTNARVDFFINFCNEVIAGQHNEILQGGNSILKKDFLNIDNNPIKNNDMFKHSIVRNSKARIYCEANNINVQGRNGRYIIFNNF